MPAPKPLDMIAGKCVLIVDGARMKGACEIDCENSEKSQGLGFLSAPFDVLTAARLGRCVQAQLDDGRSVEIGVLQVHSSGTALIALRIAA
jgi:hypothetical protein